MQGRERSLIEVGISATLGAYVSLWEATPEDLMGPSIYGKKDTKVFDAYPEIRMRSIINGYDDTIIFVTEEQEPKRSEWPKFTDKYSREIVMIADPLDRSKFFGKLLLRMAAGKEKNPLYELFKKNSHQKIWEEEVGDAPAIITGATTALSCLEGGCILYSIIVNHITQTLFLASPVGIFQLKLPADLQKVRKVNLDYIQKNGKRLNFVSAQTTCTSKKDRMRFVAFNGKSGYPENIADSTIFMDDPNSFIHHNEPGGPSRVLYLSDLQKGNGSVGFIIANGEKITEWIHWLPFVKYAMNSDGNPALVAYEVSNNRPRMKEGIMMSCYPAYSIFYMRGRDNFINVSKLRDIDPPSHFRSTLVVALWDNDFIQVAMAKQNYREISACL